MIALTPDFSAMRLTQETEASSSRGLMVSISVTPIPRSTCSISVSYTHLVYARSDQAVWHTAQLSG